MRSLESVIRKQADPRRPKRTELNVSAKDFLVALLCGFFGGMLGAYLTQTCLRDVVLTLPQATVGFTALCVFFLIAMAAVDNIFKSDK